MTTPAHRDRGGAPYDYDILASAGTHKRATVEIRDAGAAFAYQPGVALVFCGKILQHSVPPWEKGGDRVCYAHFMRDNVLRRFSSTLRTWVSLEDFGV